jgi:hypothetical protein
MYATWHAHSISLNLIGLTICGEREEIIRLFIVRFSLPPYSYYITTLLTPSVYVPPAMSETMFHTHTEPQAEITIFYILISKFQTVDLMIKHSELKQVKQF